MSVTTAEVRGTKIAYIARGVGRPLVYVHGNTGSRRWYERVMDVAGCRAVALDMPNFGESGPLPGAPDIDLYADLVADFMRALDLRDAVLVGHSLGGAVCASLAAQHGGLLSGLVLVDSSPPSGFVTPVDRHPLIERMRVDRELLSTALRATVATLDDPGFFALLVDDAMRMAEPAWIGNARALSVFDRSKQCHAFEKPVLVLWGRKDPIISEAMARETAAAFPRSRLQIMEHVGHSPLVEDPAGFVRLLAAFVAGLGKEYA